MINEGCKKRERETFYVCTGARQEEREREKEKEGVGMSCEKNLF